MFYISFTFCSVKNLITTTEQAFVAGHVSRLPLGPGQKVAFVPGPTASQVSGGGTGAFCLGWSHQPGPKAPLLSRLVSPTGTKGPHSLLSRLEPPTGTKGLGPLIPFPHPPPEPFSSLVSCCSRLGREEFLLISSPHL